MLCGTADEAEAVMLPMVTPRVKGKRREVRRMLARRSHELLEGYPLPAECPLRRALFARNGDNEANDR